MSGFGSHFESEAISGALPVGQNSPQVAPLGLYAEQISGSAFTALRHENLRSWCYRIRPSVVHGDFEMSPHPSFEGEIWNKIPTTPQQLRWQPMPPAEKSTNFVDGLFLMAGNGQTGAQGSAIYLYACNLSMADEFFYSADGEFLIVPQDGALRLRTEMGVIDIEPQEIGVVPRGVKFAVDLLEKKASGYVLENFGLPFQLPGLGPIGANGLAQPRDFLYPKANFEDREGKFVLRAKFDGHHWRARLDHSPLDVIAWHGNYSPYKYDLRRFNTINTVSFDHPDPSIFTVLTSPSGYPGVANVDFVIFPPRWMVAEHTFRPPYFHRNLMNEFMGLIVGAYDAKAGGFVPGGASLHNRMSGHGPDAETFEKASHQELKPQKIENTMAFMFESREIYRVSELAFKSSFRDLDYSKCWHGMKKNFSVGQSRP